LLALLFLLLVGGCSERDATSGAALTGRVSVKGSNTFGEELAPQLIAAYRRSRPNVAIDLESKGSVSGFAALLSGGSDIAATSRGASAEELALARTRGVEPQEYVIGYYGVAVIVHPSNPIEGLTKAQVRDIFSGTVRNWKAVGGADLAIHVCVRDPVSGTNLGFRELAMENRPYAAEAKQFTTYAQLAGAVAQNVGGIGYASMHLAEEPSIKAVKIDNTEPNALSVNEGWYPYQRMLRLYTNKATETPAARDFVRFVQREEGQKILENLGFVRRFEKRLKNLTPD
jgi:phosphate transport system substrate-binding protein